MSMKKVTTFKHAYVPHLGISLCRPCIEKAEAKRDHVPGFGALGGVGFYGLHKGLCDICDDTDHPRWKFMGWESTK